MIFEGKVTSDNNCVAEQEMGWNIEMDADVKSGRYVI